MDRSIILFAINHDAINHDAPPPPFDPAYQKLNVNGMLCDGINANTQIFVRTVIFEDNVNLALRAATCIKRENEVVIGVLPTRVLPVSEL